MRPRTLAGAQRTAAAAALMLVLLAIAATATGRGGSSSPPPGVHAASTAGHHVLVVAVIVLVPILAALGFALMLYVQIMRKRERDPEVLRRRREARRAALVVLAIVIGMVIYRLRTGRNVLGFLHLRNPFANLSSAHGRAPHVQRPHAGGGGVSGTDWTLAAIVWGLLLLAAVAVYMRTRSRGELVPVALGPPAGDEEEPGLDAVRRERNPRRAVIAAYALMERLMARDGLPRGPHEAPMEYLGRVTLHGHRGAASVHRLTALFQRARFGHRPVDEDMRRRAIAAVEELDAATDGAA